MIYLSAAFLILVGLPCMSLCHKVVAERMDEYEKRISQSEENRSSIGSHQRSTSMSSSSRLAVAILSGAEKQQVINKIEQEPRPLSSVDLIGQDNQQSSTSSLFVFSTRSDVMPLTEEDDSENENTKDTWLNQSCSYFLRICNDLKLISMEDL
jgi:hypothetical protein